MPRRYVRRLTISWIKYNVALCLEDRDLCLQAVSKFGTALRYLHVLNNDRELVSHSIMHHGNSIRFASHELQQDNDMIILAIKYHPQHIRRCTPSEDFLEKCIHINPDVFYHVSNELRRIPSIINAVLQKASHMWSSLYYIDQLNPIYIRTALKQGPVQIQLPQDWFRNHDNIMAMVDIEPKVLIHIPLEVKYVHNMLEAIAKNEKCILYTTELFSRNFIMHAVRVNPYVIPQLHTIGNVSKFLELFAVRCNPAILPLCHYRNDFTIPSLASYAYDGPAFRYLMVATLSPSNLRKLRGHGKHHMAMLLRRIGSYLYLHIVAKERYVYHRTMLKLIEYA